MDFGLIVDLETTGLDSSKDRVIEIGIVEFAVGGGLPPSITGMYSEVEDPGMSLPPKVVEITGLRDELLTGRQIDWALVKRYFDRASVVIAHNVEFDSAFLKRRPELGGLPDVHWACSVRHIPWDRLGFGTKALNYLAADHGFVNPFPHRALFDCATTFRLVAPHLDRLIAASYEREFRVAARGAPFDMKDKLRERGYRWDNSERVWWKEMIESYLVEEREWLAREVYNGQSRHEEIPRENVTSRRP